MEIRPLRVLSALRLHRLNCHFECNKFSSSSLNSQSSISTVAQCRQKADLNTQQNKIRLESVPGFIGLEQYRDKISIIDKGGEYLYEDLYMRSWDLAKGLIGILGDRWADHKICVLCDTGLSHVITAWSCWMLGSTVVPLPINGAKDKLEHIIRDSGASVVISTKSQADNVNSITKSAEVKLIVLDESWWKNPESVTDRDTPLPAHFVDNSVYKDGNALVLYTVGRSYTSRGIILSHSTLANQINSVVDSWDVSSDDVLLHSLNLHQVFPLVSCLYAPLSQRAKVLTLDSFNEGKVWSHLLGVNKSDQVSLFPATPAMYQKLLQQSQVIFKDKKSREYVKVACMKKIRLMTSNSTKLPEDVTSQWATLTGHKILNNFVCTESGVTITGRVCSSSSGSEQSQKIYGCVAPVEGMNIKIVKFRDHLKTAFDVLLEDQGGKQKKGTIDLGLAEDGEEEKPVIGELLLKGDNVADRFITGTEETEAVNHGGWIATGDIVAYKDGAYRVRGKLGIKGVEVAGEVLNSEDLERKLLRCSYIDDTTVVGLGDTDAEQQIAAVVVVNKNNKVTLDNIITWCHDNIGEKSVPSVLKIVENIPRDNTGHIDKMAVFALFPDVDIVCFHDTKF